jgi:hypothetical protein
MVRPPSLFRSASVKRSTKTAYRAPDDTTLYERLFTMLTVRQKRVKSTFSSAWTLIKRNQSIRKAWVQIPTEVGHLFRLEAGHNSDLKAATIPI